LRNKKKNFTQDFTKEIDKAPEENKNDFVSNKVLLETIDLEKIKKLANNLTDIVSKKDTLKLKQEIMTLKIQNIKLNADMQVNKILLELQKINADIAHLEKKILETRTKQEENKKELQEKYQVDMTTGEIDFIKGYFKKGV